MNRSGLLAVVPLLIALPLSGSAAETRNRAKTKPRQPLTHTQPKLVPASLEKKIHDLINGVRKEHGLPPLAWDDTLALIARRHSEDMVARGYFSHTSPEGHDFLFRYQQGGYRCEVPVGQAVYQGAENIYQNNLYDSVTTVNGKRFTDWNSEDQIAATTVEGWMQSPGHRKNILNPHWGRVGIGISISSDGKVFFTQDFC